MSGITAGIEIVGWAMRAVALPAVRPVPVDDWPKVEELRRQTDIEQARRIDEDPASPDPKRKPETGPKPEPMPEPQPFDQDKGTCQLLPPSDELRKKLKTQVVIAFNCEQAMRDAYNRGYATGRAVSKRWRNRCPLIKADGAFLSRRLKRIILQQENGPRGTTNVWSRNP